MEIQTSLWEKPVLEADIVYTPTYVSEQIVRWLNPKGKCLDPCKGDGAFYNYLPSDKDYCEIRGQRLFFIRGQSRLGNWKPTIQHI